MKPEGLRNVRTKGERIFEQVLARTERADRNPSWGQRRHKGRQPRYNLGKAVGDETTVNVERDGETLNLKLNLTLASSQRFCLSVCCLSVCS